MGPRDDVKRDCPRWWKNLSLAGLLALGGGCFAAYNYYPLTNDVQGVAVGVGVGFPALFFFTIHLLGRTGLHRYKTRGFVNFGSLAGLFGLGFGAVGVANGACDPHPLEYQEVRVTQVPHGYNQSGEAVEDWRPGHKGDEIILPRLPDGVRPGDRVVVITGPGLVGYWFEDVRPLPPPQQQTQAH